MKKSLFLLRGLPGSGKSKIANELSEEGKYPVYSVDDYFTDLKSGSYQFEYDKNHIAYSQCLTNVENSMKGNVEKIFVHNTFTMEWEMEPYFRMAAMYQYTVHVMTVENRHGQKSIHNIPQEQIEKMAEKYKVILY